MASPRRQTRVTGTSRGNGAMLCAHRLHDRFLLTHFDGRDAALLSDIYVCLEEWAMRSLGISRKLLLAAIIGFGAWGCSSSTGEGGGSGGTNPPEGSGG